MATLETIEALLKDFKKNTEDHLARLNGSVAENTKFRWKVRGGFAVLSFIGIGTILGLITLWIKSF